MSSDAVGSGPVKSNLERRYRALLRLLPGWYRVEREEEMVETFLADRTDDLDLEHGWPGWGEAGATLALSVRVRLGERRPAGTALRVLALTGLLGQLVAAAQSWTVIVMSGGSVRPQGWWYDAVAVVAFAALVAGRRAVGRVAAGSLGMLALVPVVMSVAAGFGPWWVLLWQVPVLLTAVAAVAGFHREAPPVPRRWWAIGPVAVVAGAATAVFAPALSSATMLAAWLIAAVVVALFRPWSARPPVPAGA